MSNTQIADISVLENLQVTQNTKVVASQMAVFNELTPDMKELKRQIEEYIELLSSFISDSMYKIKPQLQQRKRALHDLSLKWFDLTRHHLKDTEIGHANYILRQKIDEADDFAEESFGDLWSNLKHLN